MNSKITVVDAICGAGKAQPLYSNILTKDGYRKMGEIKVGEKIFGEDGKLHTVVGVFPQGYKDVYEVEFQDGSTTRCCDEHLWTYQLPHDRSSDNYRTNTLREIMDLGIYKTIENKLIPQIYIPMIKPIEFTHREVELDAWLLGAILGDESINAGTYPATTNYETDIVERVDDILDESKLDSLSLIEILSKYGLMEDIFIPKEYKLNSKEIRIEILRGIIDTNGFIASNGDIVFSTPFTQLLLDMKFLVESLGGTASITMNTSKYTYFNGNEQEGIKHTIHIKQPNELNLFSSSKHTAKKTISNQEGAYRQISKITYIGKEKCQCIKVDNPSELYITDNFIVTHNTSWAIQHVKEPFSGMFIYVTPYLSEIQRVIESTEGDFKEPSNNNEKGSKLEGLKNLIVRGENIACTHELFKMCDKETLELIKEAGYTLILDEVLNVINPIKITPSDLRMLIDTKTIEINETTGHINWIDNNYKGKFEELKHLSKNDNLFLFNNTFVFWTLHHESFEAFKEVYILTYLFDGQIQRYYYDLHNFNYEKKSVVKEGDRYKLVEYNPKLDNRERIAKRLNIYEDKGKSKFNSNFCKKPAFNMFSSTWLKRCDDKTLERIKKNINSYFRSVEAGTKNSFWTTVKEVAPKIKGGRAIYYTTEKRDNFVSVNIRATNEYKDCIACAYVYNRFMNPIEKAFFEFHGVKVDEDTLAVSDLIQFIFRGVIRNDQEDSILNVYIPSLRMRELLYKFLNYEI